MGRTLQYKITNIHNKNFNAAELAAINKFNKEINSGKFKNAWTCENLFISAYYYYPNWKSNAFDGRGVDIIWKAINKRYKELEKSTMSHDAIIGLMAKQGLVIISDEKLHQDALECHDTQMWSPKVNELDGFVKTASNEVNTIMVYLGLVALSKLVPSMRIELHDEGGMLTSDLVIQEGKTIINLKDIQTQISEIATKTFMNMPYLNLMIDTDEIPENMRELVYLSKDGDSNDATVEVVQDIQELLNTFKEFSKNINNVSFNSYDDSNDVQDKIFKRNDIEFIQNPFNFIKLDQLEFNQHPPFPAPRILELINAIAKKAKVTVPKVLLDDLQALADNPVVLEEAQ